MEYTYNTALHTLFLYRSAACTVTTSTLNGEITYYLRNYTPIYNRDDETRIRIRGEVVTMIDGKYVEGTSIGCLYVPDITEIAKIENNEFIKVQCKCKGHNPEQLNLFNL